MGNSGENLSGKKRNHTLPLWTVFLLSFFLVALLYLLFKDRAFGGSPQMTDIIIDQPAMEGSNKTGEYDFFWLLLWIGCFAILGLFLIGRNFFAPKSSEEIDLQKSDKTLLHPLYKAALCFLPPLVQLVIYGNTSILLLLFSFCFALILFFAKDHTGNICSLFLICYFDIQVLGVVASLWAEVYPSDKLLFLLGIILFAMAAMIYGRFPALRQKIVCLSQLPLPLLLLLYTKHTYLYQGETLTLSYPSAYLLCIGIMITALYVSLIFTMLQQKKADISDRDQRNVFTASAISIFLYGSYIPAALMVQSDLHHHGEQLLPFQQIVMEGSKAYESYYPVSGLFPMLIGGINQLLFGGKATTYSAAFVVLFLLFGALILFLISRYVKGIWILTFAFLFHMPVYCRTWIILPALLLLSLPKVIENKRRFLYLYTACGFLGGLYYPLFGLSLIVAGLPFALIQLYAYLKEKKLKEDLKTKGFYLESLVLLLPILLSIPLLIRMAKHILAYSHQTLLADGLSLSTVFLPEWFLPYLSSHAEWQDSIYRGLRFLGGMVPVWLFLLLLLSFLYQNRNKKPYMHPLFLGLSSGFLILPVCYTYTMVIMDETWVSRLFSRSSHLYLWVLAIFLPILILRYGESLFKSQKAAAFLLACLLSVPFLTFYNMRDYGFPVLDGVSNRDSACVGEYGANLHPFPVSPDYVPISKEDQSTFPNLGNGFMSASVRDSLYAYESSFNLLHAFDPEAAMMGLDTGQLYYFLLNEKALYSGKISLAKSREAAEDVIGLIDSHTAVGSDLRPLQNYYIYRYLLENGWLYDTNTGFYVSKEAYTLMYGTGDYERASLSDSPWAAPIYIGKCAQSLGHNLKNLSGILHPVSTPSEFLYVEINKEALAEKLAAPVNEDTILLVSWNGKGSLLFDLGDGTLLLPLAANADWAMGNYEQIWIGIYDQQIPMSEQDTGVLLDEVSDGLQYYELISEF
ncbi:MAG: hypothetical protein J1E61_05105 [Lachnospiraceae bacterium]|nr:hypothetical protein [Lachnospiraceae bacterium]